MALNPLYNPLFLRELTQTVNNNEEKLPETIYDVIMSRLDTLKDIHKYILQNASVVGQSFDTDTLQDLLLVNSK